MSKLFFVLTLLFMSCFTAGCATPWEQFYHPNPVAKGMTFAPTVSAEVRTIPFERLKNFLDEMKERMVNSSVAPQDLSPSEKLALKNRLMETLQLTERGNEAGAIGWSEFWYTKVLDPDNGDLQRFAQKIGANYAVVATTYGGQFNQTVEMPLTSFYSTSYFNRRGYAGSSLSTDTTYVPTQVTRDRFIYDVVFVRRLTPADNKALGR